MKLSKVSFAQDLIQGEFCQAEVLVIWLLQLKTQDILYVFSQGYSSSKKKKKKKKRKQVSLVPLTLSHQNCENLIGGLQHASFILAIK